MTDSAGNATPPPPPVAVPILTASSRPPAAAPDPNPGSSADPASKLATPSAAPQAAAPSPASGPGTDPASNPAVPAAAPQPAAPSPAPACGAQPVYAAFCGPSGAVFTGPDGTMFQSVAAAPYLTAYDNSFYTGASILDPSGAPSAYTPLFQRQCQVHSGTEISTLKQRCECDRASLQAALSLLACSWTCRGRMLQERMGVQLPADHRMLCSPT